MDFERTARPGDGPDVRRDWWIAQIGEPPGRFRAHQTERRAVEFAERDQVDYWRDFGVDEVAGVSRIGHRCILFQEIYPVVAREPTVARRAARR